MPVLDDDGLAATLPHDTVEIDAPGTAAAERLPSQWQPILSAGRPLERVTVAMRLWPATWLGAIPEFADRGS